MLKKLIGRPIFLSSLIFAFIALLFGLWSHYNLNPHAVTELTLKSGTAFPIARQIKPFELKNAADGAPFNNEQLKGHWSMLFFGFTNCALLCPTTLTSLNKFYNELGVEHVTQMPQVVFVSIDPERDTLSKINKYVSSFNKNFRGATGTTSQLDNMTNELNILYAKVATNDGEDYQIDHSGTVLVFNPDGNLAALFSPPIDAKMLAEDYKTLLNATNERGR